MFNPNMVAPCGLDCTICTAALKADKPCPGCNGSNENKPDFCATRCEIINCSNRQALHGDYCDVCSQYPCEYIKEREYRYQNQYPLPESPMSNLKKIRANGMSCFLEEQSKEWTCPECGGIICVHTGLCNRCLKNFGQEK